MHPDVQDSDSPVKSLFLPRPTWYRKLSYGYPFDSSVGSLFISSPLLPKPLVGSCLDTGRSLRMVGAGIRSFRNIL